MKQLKAVAPYLATFALACGTFVGGYYTGMTSAAKVAADIFSPVNMQDIELQVMDDDVLMFYLDRREATKAADYLRTREDGNILAIRDLSPYADARTREMACKLIKAIAQRRAKYSEKPAELADMQAKVDSLLKSPPMCDKHAGQVSTRLAQ